MGVTKVSDSGTTEAQYTILDETYDTARRTRTTHVLYELTTGNESLTAEREWIIHWFPDDVFRDLAATAGLRVTFSDTGDAQKEAVLHHV